MCITTVTTFFLYKTLDFHVAKLATGPFFTRVWFSGIASGPRPRGGGSNPSAAIFFTKVDNYFNAPYFLNVVNYFRVYYYFLWTTLKRLIIF